MQVFPLLSTQLFSLTEAINLCPGFRENCGDEIDPDKELCPTHQREEDEYYLNQARAQQLQEDENSKSQYQHLVRQTAKERA